MTKMVILDRDGVINHDSDEYIKSAQEWVAIKGSLEAIARLKKAGYLVTVASNQSGLGRGYFDQETLDQIHDKMKQQLAQRGAELDGIFYCPHRPNDNCVCRKPKPGLLLQIAKQFDIRLGETVFVGDTLADVQAARMCGAKPVLVKTGKGMRTLEKPEALGQLPVYSNLSDFVREYLRKNDG